MEKKEIIVKKSKKILSVLTDMGFSYNTASKLLRNKDVRINGVKVKENLMVNIGDEIEVYYTSDRLGKKYDIIFEDENILVLNKFSGIEVEGEDGITKLTGTLAVHRLDRNTQGLLILAKNKEIKAQLINAFKSHKIVKKYIAEVYGNADFDGKEMVAYLTKDSENSRVYISDKKQGKAVIIKNRFKTLKRGTTSLILIELVTGKTHQIRAHLAHLGFPIIGDGKYGKNEINKKFKQNTQKLYCCYIKINGLCGKFNYLNGKEFIYVPEFISKSSFYSENIFK